MRENAWQAEMMTILTLYKEKIRTHEYVNRIYPDTTPNKAIHICVKMFEKIEANILAEHRKNYVTDDYENEVIYFTAQLVRVILENRNIFEKCAEYKKLLGQRHVAYAIYDMLYKKEMFLEEYKKILLSEENIYIITFVGLINFYREYYGKFSDNEKAIALLCGFYPKNIKLDEKIEADFVSVLYVHITNMGTPSDLGYAFNGINQIEKYIGNLPEYIVEKLLKMYGLYYILNDKVQRHQIFTIIKYSKMENRDKQKSKFFFLDSLVIADQLDKFLFANYIDLPQVFKGEVQPHYDRTDQNLQGKELLVFEKPRAYWTNELSVVRKFYIDEMCFIEIEFKNNQIAIKSKVNAIEQLFDYDDWSMDSYRSREFEDAIGNIIMSNGAKKPPVQMAFSLVHLENYRGIATRTMDFDHRFEVNSNNEIIRKPKSEERARVKFYGKNIYSMTCIVGRNGTGKTSIIDFLRETFFKLLKLIEEADIPIIEGCIKEEDYNEYGLMDKNVRFFVIFKMGGKDFSLTNDKQMKISAGANIKPYKRRMFKSWNDLSKIVYFSNMLNLNQNLFMENEVRSQNFDDNKKEKKRQAQVLNNFRQIDCSEKNSYLSKMRAIEGYKKQLDINAGKDNNQTSEDINEKPLNKELYMQLAFLEQLSDEELSKHFDMYGEKKFCVRSEFSKRDISFYNIADVKEVFQEGEMNDFLYLPDARIDYFSSGQYAKFSFLAKLHWIISGYQEKRNNLDLNISKVQFTDEDALLAEDSVLIFIDEGELYYHPEWQRRYIKTLLDIVKRHEGAIQIIITTNSPFILSDIRKEDVCYLSDKAEAEEETFGQNIHKLLKDNFFMEYTIGEYSRNLIEKIMSWLAEPDKKDGKNLECSYQQVLKEVQEFYGDEVQCSGIFERINQLIDQIGEPVYHDTLKRRLKISPFFDEQERIKQLQSEKQRIENEIKKLEKNIYD